MFSSFSTGLARHNMASYVLFVLDIVFFIPWVPARALGRGRGNTSGCSGQSPARKKKHILAEVVRWKSVGSAAARHKQTASSSLRRKEKKKKPREQDRGSAGGISLKAPNPPFPSFLFCPLAMLRDGSFPENLNNGFGQHLLRAHWRPRIQQTQLPTVHKMSRISHGDSREQDENGGTDFAGFHSNRACVCFMHEPPLLCSFVYYQPCIFNRVSCCCEHLSPPGFPVWEQPLLWWARGYCVVCRAHRFEWKWGSVVRSYMTSLGNSSWITERKGKGFIFSTVADCCCLKCCLIPLICVRRLCFFLPAINLPHDVLRFVWFRGILLFYLHW